MSLDPADPAAIERFADDVRAHEGSPTVWSTTALPISQTLVGSADRQLSLTRADN